MISRIPNFMNVIEISLYILREVCAPNNCALGPGEEVCRDESRMQMQNVPEEDCDLQPEETCHMEAVLVPRCVHLLHTYLVDVLWCQPIKLIQVVSTSEFYDH